ncbi:acylphosphatase [Corynebacterium breve]|uniref:acylphosphatase n=1 Tax=Corynebacterium breve TaxID=3049799 RepID=A0ABY8VDU1_9CORY|nr:acylphosphatase [Corynebacterium breve]WIM66910.1 acylphosphatase [Corynebacterium breve]
MTTIRVTAFVHGRVQGVGFRWWTRSQALGLGLNGHAANLVDGRVEVVAEGERAVVAKLLQLLEEEPSSAGRPGRVDTVVTLESDPRGERGFHTR